jgi:hypothetical protein
MPRVRTAARAFVAVACLAGLLGSARARPNDADAQKREEIDAVQRQDVAEALRVRFGINVDWRTTPLDRLLDIRLRAAKAAELQARLGASVDWQRHSWLELEALRRTLLSFEAKRGGEQPLAPPSLDALVQPRFKPVPAARADAKATRATPDPDAIIRPTFAARPEPRHHGGDPDAVLRPTFAPRPAAVQSGTIDPDGLITPTFAPRRRLVAALVRDPDDLIAPLEPTAHDGAPAHRGAPSVPETPPVLWAPPAPPVPMAPPAPPRW